MEKGALAVNTMNGLIQRLSKGNKFIHLQDSNGDVEAYTCSLNPPATDDDINYLIAESRLVVPEDYLSFIRYCNGCSLFDHYLYGGENIIYHSDEVVYGYKKLKMQGILPVANILQENIVIDCNAYERGEQEYVYAKISSSLNEPGINLHCNFETWLYRFIICDGNKYWNWTIGGKYFE